MLLGAACDDPDTTLARTIPYRLCTVSYFSLYEVE
jgi:hypothetical protein